MQILIRRISLGLAAGFLGAFVNALLVWYLGCLGIPQKLNLAIATTWSAQSLYPRLVWGALWGLLLAIPGWKGGFWVSVFSRGILLSLLPTAFQLLHVFPVLTGKGMFGIALGRLTPVFVCFHNAVWGFLAALWVYLAKNESLT